MYEHLGLASVRVTDPGRSPWSFEWLRHEMAEPPAYVTRPATWLVGERNGVAVVVRPLMLPGDAPYVAVVAEIDPPLLTGLFMLSRSLLEPFRFEPQGTALGVAPIDRAYTARAHDRHRAQRLFSRVVPHDTFAWDIGAAGERNPLCIDDRVVGSYISGVQPREDRIDQDIDLVTSLARRFSERTTILPERAEEDEGRDSWARVADGWSLGFDKARWKISGQNEGRRIEVILEGVPPAVSTIVRVSFRIPLGIGLFLRSGFRDKKTPLLGYPEIDHWLLFDARDRERGSALLADPAVRTVLAAEARSANVTMTDWSVTAARGGFMRGRDVSARIEALAAIVNRVTPLMRTAGPFR